MVRPQARPPPDQPPIGSAPATQLADAVGAGFSMRTDNAFPANHRPHASPTKKQKRAILTKVYTLASTFITYPRVRRAVRSSFCRQPTTVPLALPNLARVLPAAGTHTLLPWNRQAG